jgi:hypothetical protein
MRTSYDLEIYARDLSRRYLAEAERERLARSATSRAPGTFLWSIKRAVMPFGGLDEQRLGWRSTSLAG